MAGWLRGAQWRGLRGSFACAAGGAQRRNCAGLTGRARGLMRADFVDAGQLALVRGIKFTRQRVAGGCAIFVFAGCCKGYLTGVRPALTMKVQLVWLASQTLCPKIKMTIPPVFRDLRRLNFQVLSEYFPAGAVLCFGPATGEQHGG